MDFVALEETRLPDSGSIKEINFTFFWQVKSPDETSEQGIDFAVRNTLLGSIIPPADGSERILSLHPHSSVGPVTLISAYAPRLSSPGEAKDKSYDELVTVIKAIPEKKLLFILGELNARVGEDQSLACLAHFGTILACACWSYAVITVHVSVTRYSIPSPNTELETLKILALAPV